MGGGEAKSRAGKGLLSRGCFPPRRADLLVGTFLRKTPQHPKYVIMRRELLSLSTIPRIQSDIIESEIIQAMSASDFFTTVEIAKEISLCHLRHPRQQIHMARHQMPSEAHGRA